MNSRRKFFAQIAGIGALAMGVKPLPRTGTLITTDVKMGAVVLDEAFIPECWARDGLAILEENLTICTFVPCDYEQ